jgi:hypothetical protein
MQKSSSMPVGDMQMFRLLSRGKKDAEEELERTVEQSLVSFHQF